MLLSTLILLLPAICYLLGALAGHGSGWQVARSCASMALLTSVLAAAAAIMEPLLPSPWIAASPLNLIMSTLVSLLGFIIVRYSAAYMAGDSAERHYRTWLQLCLASVSLVVISNHLLLLLLAWCAISACLHQLLVSYPDRYRAVLAAHKKFIFARLAELCVLGAALLLWQQHGSFRISDIMAAYSADMVLTTGQEFAALLLALAALIKCAQLPVHGWLMQVVEAPTPVSALLHAGIINLGGYLMILTAPLIAVSGPARWLLLIVAGLTAVLAALVMVTRISIKVRLAWSTSAQMGLMLVECALGLYELALLHLLAHSCYKAHAFLSSGSTVFTHLDKQLVGGEPLNLGLWLRNLLASLMLVALVVMALPDMPSPAAASAWLLVAVALSLLLPASAQPAALLRRLVLALAVVIAYLAQKTLLDGLVPDTPEAGWAAALWIVALLTLLLAGHGLLVMHQTALAYRWRQWLFAGLYLDEWVTRTTLKLWPVPLPAAAARKPGQPAPSRSTQHERIA